jgi:zinc transport system substrate-binding protein
MEKLLFLMIFAAAALVAKPLVAVSIEPQKFVVEKIAGDSVELLIMSARGTNHETYEPRAAQMRSLAKADIYFTIGLPFEKIWLERFRAGAPEMQIASIDKGISKRHLEEHHHGVDHEHDELDPHIWLDPMLLKTQAKNILDTLAARYPANENAYKQNYEVLVSELDALNIELGAKLKPLTNRAFFAVHPSFGYFAARYDLEQIEIETEGSEPKIAQLIAKLKAAQGKNVRIILLEPQANAKTAQLAARESGARVVRIDPMSSDIPSVLRELASELTKE